MKQFSEETRRKMSESAKRRCSNPKWLEHQHSRGTQLPLDRVKAMHEAGHTQSEIAGALGVSQKVVWRFMKNHGIKASVKRVLMQAPTADVVEVRHGEWVLHKDGSGTCSECQFTQKNVWDFENWQNFCGHCGAKMDGGKKK